MRADGTIATVANARDYIIEVMQLRQVEELEWELDLGTWFPMAAMYVDQKTLELLFYGRADGWKIDALPRISQMSSLSVAATTYFTRSGATLKTDSPSIYKSLLALVMAGFQNKDNTNYDYFSLSRMPDRTGVVVVEKCKWIPMRGLGGAPSAV